MWIAPKAYMATLLARGKSQEYIDRIMVAPELDKILLFVVSILLGALMGAVMGQKSPIKCNVKALKTSNA